MIVDATEVVDLDRCANPDCRAPLHFFARAVARHRATPQLCWPCARKVVPPKEALHRRVQARQPTVMRLPDAGSTDPVA